MSRYRASSGRYLRADWATTTVKALLLDVSNTYVFDTTHEFVDDLTPGSNELTATGYARLTVGTSTPDWYTSTMWRWGIDNPVFPTLGSGTEQTTGIVFYEHVTDDTDSLLLAHFSFAAVTLDGTDFTVTVTGGGLFLEDP